MKEKRSQILTELLRIIRSSKGWPMASDRPEQYIINLCYLECVDRGEIRDGDTKKALVKFANDRVNEISDVKHALKSIISNLSNEEITDLTLETLNIKTPNKFSSLESSKELCNAVYDFLEIKNGDSLFDFGVGNGVFLANCLARANSESLSLKSVSGIDIIGNSVYVTTEALNILDRYGHTDINISIHDGLEGVKTPYNKAYVFSPVGQSLLFRTNEYTSGLYPDIVFKSQFMEQWVFIDRMLSAIKGNDCRAVAVVYKKTLLQMQNNIYAQRLLDDGWIEGIYEIPSDIIPETTIDAYLVVFSKNNKSVSIEDSSSFDKVLASLKEINYSEQYNEDINHIAAEFKSYHENELYDGDKQKNTIEKLKQLDTWLPYYQSFATDQKKVHSLSTLAECTVCCQYTVSMFDVTDEDTKYRILTSSDIENTGEINWDNLTHIKMDKTTFDKYCLRKGDVIVTTKSSKVKVAVVDRDLDDNNYKVIVTGGMLLIRPKIDVLDPVFLKLYLDSSRGADAIRTCQSGSTIIHLSPKMFFNISIPDTPIEEQRELAKKYNSKMSSLNVLKNEITSLENEISHLYDEEMEK